MDDRWAGLPSMPTRLGELVADHPERMAFVHVAPDGRETAVTWSQLDRRARQLAGALAERGVGLGDRVGLGLPNTPQLVFGAFASWLLGATPVPIRWDLPEWERTRLREVVDPTCHLDETDLDWIDATSDHPIPDLVDVISPSVNGICSSGSTGTPKVILMNRPAVFDERASVPMMDGWREVPRPQVILVLSPMYHTNGFASLLYLLGGDQLVLLEKFDAARIVDLIETHRVSTFIATPTMLQRIADRPDIDERDLSSIEWILQGAAPMPPSLVDRWAGLIGADRIVMAYGMTEAIGITVLRGDEWMSHRGSVGRGYRETEIRILDEAGGEVPPGTVGDIYMKSPFYGGSTYLGASAMPQTQDGFATVGDMGWLDEDGYLYIADRRVDLIITGGANVFPAEVEAALIDHPEIADVVVVGLRDAQWGKRVHAIVQARRPDHPPAVDEVRAYARDRLAPYKVPKTVEFVDEIPRSAATKVNRGALVAERDGA